MLSFLAPRLKNALAHVNLNLLYELRIRTDKPLRVNAGGSFTYLGEAGLTEREELAIRPTAAEVEETLFAASGLVLQDWYLKIIVRLYPSYENTAYLDGGTSLINIVRIIGVFVLSVLYYRQAVAGQKQNRFYFHLNFFALLLYTCGSFVPEISRVGYYMTAGHIFLLPSLVSRIGSRRQRRFWRTAVVVAAVLYFAIFLIKAQDLLVRIVPYHTWIFPAEITGKAV